MSPLEREITGKDEGKNKIAKLGGERERGKERDQIVPGKNM